jgi:hypothetical protein
MSSPPGPAAGIGNQTGAALGIVGSILGILLLFLVGLFLLRYVVNIFIDLCILCDPQEARRTTIDFSDKVCSICLRCRRISPESNSSSSGVDPDNRTPDSHGENPSHTNLNPLDVRLSELSYVDRKAVLKHLIEKEVSVLYVYRNVVLAYISHTIHDVNFVCGTIWKNQVLSI